MTLRELRESKGMSAAALSRKIGIDRSTICRWETGARVPSLQAIKELKETFKTTYNILIPVLLETKEQGEEEQ